MAAGTQGCPSWVPCNTVPGRLAQLGRREASPFEVPGNTGAAEWPQSGNHQGCPYDSGTGCRQEGGATKHSPLRAMAAHDTVALRHGMHRPQRRLYGGRVFVSRHSQEWRSLFQIPAFFLMFHTHSRTNPRSYTASRRLSQNIASSHYPSPRPIAVPRFQYCRACRGVQWDRAANPCMLRPRPDSGSRQRATRQAIPRSSRLYARFQQVLGLSRQNAELR